jgi:CBS domain containing-hemolysin-like protein
MLGGRRGEPAEHDLSTDELRALLELSRRHGVINPTEDTFLRAAIALNSLRIRDVMVPRVELRAYDVNASPSGLRDLMRSTRLKRIPVYDGAIDNIVGLVYAKVLFLEPDKKLRDLLMPVRFVPEMISCEQLLEHFRKTRTQLAIVVDEYGGVAGLVTLEDVLEEIVGDIHDPEEKPGEPEILQLSPTEYEVSGMLGVRFWAETFGLPRLVDRVSTVGGLVAARLGRTARAGDAVRFGNLELRVAQVDRRRVKRVRLRLLQGAPS